MVEYLRVFSHVGFFYPLAKPWRSTASASTAQGWLMAFMSASRPAVRLTMTLLVAFLSRNSAGPESLGVVLSIDAAGHVAWRRGSPTKSPTPTGENEDTPRTHTNAPTHL